MVQMALALKSVDLNRMVFVQYPVTDDPVDANKVVPNAMLAWPMPRSRSRARARPLGPQFIIRP